MDIPGKISCWVRKTLFAVLLIAAPLGLFAQVSAEKKSQASEERIVSSSHKKLLDSAEFYKKQDITKSLTFIENSLKVLPAGNTDKKAQSFSTLGDIYLYWNQYDLAVANYKNALNAKNDLATSLKLAKAYFLNKNYAESLAVYQKLIGNRALSPYQQVTLYEGLGEVYEKRGDFGEAVKQYQKGLQIATEHRITPKITNLNSRIADAYSQSGNAIQAESYYKNSLQLASRENTGRAVQEKEKVADFYRKENKYDKEIALRQSALEDAEELNEQAQASSAFAKPDSLTPQRINYKIGDAFIAKNQPQQAIPYLQKSIAQAGEEADLSVQKDATRKLSEVYKTVGAYDKALETYQKYVQLVDVLYEKKEEELARVAQFSKDIALQQSRITGLEQERQLSESRYQLALKEQQLVTENNKRQQLIIYSLLFGLLLMGLTTYFLYRSNRQQTLTNRVLALKSLRSQMNPHFIFNALNSINNFIARNDERSANRFLSDFSTLMRSVLENSEKDFISLPEELELLRRYVALEHARFPEKFEYYINVEENVRAKSFQIPPMLLQPYVENAIWHGLRYKEGKGRLAICVQQPDEGSIEIQIEDDGIGRKRSARLKTEHQRKQPSKAMGNIEKRIAILNKMYPGKIFVRVDDASEDGTGTKVSLILKR